MTRPALFPTIRPMTSADLAVVVNLAASLDQAPHWPLPAYLRALDPQALPPRIALVATDLQSNGVLGFAVASLLSPQAELESIAVAAPAQRRGLAHSLFAALLDNLRPRGITEVTLEVRASNRPALQLYHSLGFAPTARRPRYYANPVEDAILLSLQVSQHSTNPTL